MNFIIFLDFFLITTNTESGSPVFSFLDDIEAFKVIFCFTVPLKWEKWKGENIEQSFDLNKKKQLQQDNSSCFPGKLCGELSNTLLFLALTTVENSGRDGFTRVGSNIKSYSLHRRNEFKMIKRLFFLYENETV